MNDSTTQTVDYGVITLLELVSAIHVNGSTRTTSVNFNLFVALQAL